MSKKTYYDNPYIFGWEAEVSEVRERGGKLAVALSETAFYPGGGGQPADSGSIGGVSVLELYEENDTVFHLLPMLPGEGRLICSIDADRRLDHMQQHTGQHLLSAVFYQLYRGETAGFHLGEEVVTIDITLDEITEEMIRKVEDRVNGLIYKNLSVITHVLPPEEAARLPLRKLPPEAGEIRVVEIDGLDYSPCCGTHLAGTGELGMVRILRGEKYKGMTRVYFLCGRRCLADYRNKSHITSALSRQLSAPEEEIPSLVARLAGEARRLTKELKDLREEAGRLEAARLTGEGQDAAVAFYEHKSAEEVQAVARHALQMADGPVLLASLPDKKLFLGHGGKAGLDCGKLFKERLKDFRGRGGGSSGQAQAAFESVEDLLEFGRLLKSLVLGGGRAE